MIITLYDRTLYKLRRGGEDDEELMFGTIGLPQGTALSPVLFNLVMNYVLDTMDLDDKIKLITMFTENGEKIEPENQTTFLMDRLLYADDIALLATTKAALQKKLNTINQAFLRHGLLMSGEKTEWMVFNDAFKKEEIMLEDGKKLNRVNEFIYLGSVFTPDCKCDEDVNRRIKLAHIAIRPLNGLLWSNKLSRKRKVKLIKCFCYPILSYSCECWTLTAPAKKLLNVVWMKFMRRCYGVTLLDRVRNQDILDTLEEDNLVDIIADRRQRFAAHCYRMGTDRVTKRILTASYPEQNQKFISGWNSWRKQTFGELKGLTNAEVKGYFSKDKDN